MYSPEADGFPALLLQVQSPQSPLHQGHGCIDQPGTSPCSPLQYEKEARSFAQDSPKMLVLPQVISMSQPKLIELEFLQ